MFIINLKQSHTVHYIPQIMKRAIDKRYALLKRQCRQKRSRIFDVNLRRETETVITRTMRYTQITAVPNPFLALRNVFMHDGRQLSSLHALRVELKRAMLGAWWKSFSRQAPRFSCPGFSTCRIVDSVPVRGTYIDIGFALRVYQDLVNSSRSAELRSNNKAHASLSNNHHDYIFIKDHPSVETVSRSRISTS